MNDRPAAASPKTSCISPARYGRPGFRRARRGTRRARGGEGGGRRHTPGFFWTLHAVFVKRHEHSLIFDQAFRIFFRRRGYIDQLMAMMLPQAPQTPRPPEAGATRIHEALFAGLDDKLKKSRRSSPTPA